MNGWIRNRFTDETSHRFHRAFVAVITALILTTPAAADEAQWIWTPEHGKEGVPTGESCFFRKGLNLKQPEAGQIAIAADDQYELFINGRRIGVGEATKKLDEYDISKLLVRGANV